MSYSHQFVTEKGVYRLLRTTHGFSTEEDLITPERFQSLDGIVLEVTGDDKLHNPPENVFKISTHEQVIKTAQSLGDKSPAIYVVDVHMAKLLTADLMLDAGGVFLGAVLAISGIHDLKTANRNTESRRGFLKGSTKGMAKIAAAVPLGTVEKFTMITLGFVKGEIGDRHPLSWNYFDLLVPDIAVGRDAVYARTIEEGLVPMLQNRKFGHEAVDLDSERNTKIKIDIHCGAGHKRIPRFIQKKEARDKVLNRYAQDNYSVFNSRYLHMFFEFQFDPASKEWMKKEYSIDLFRSTHRQ